MSDAIVRSAFETRLAAWAAAQVPPIPVAYENAPFTPPAGRYARCYLMPAPAASETLGGEHRRRMGAFQVSLCLPIGTGPAAGAALAASLDAAFPMTQPMLRDGLRIFLLDPMGPAPAIQEPDRYVLPVSCIYRADQII